MSSRSAESEVSSGPFPGWESLWPEISAEVERKVRRKLPPGVEPSDVSNEVAARLLAAANVPPADRLRFWCLAVARCVVADLYRRRTLHERDLPLVPSCDVEQLAISRLRLGSVVDAVAALSEADRDALTRTATPMTDAVKARRKRARKRIRDRMTQSVGAGVAFRRLRWLAASGAVAAAVPFVGGLSPLPGTVGEQAQVEAQVTAPQTAASAAITGPPPAGSKNPAGTISRPATAPASGAGDVPVISVGISGAVVGGAGSFDPGESGPPPLACARNLRVAEDVCIEHPLR